MKENEKLITVLNQILLDELSAINQNMFHSKVSNNLGYGELYEDIEKETTEEIKQAEWLVKRIIFLEAWRTHQPSISVSQNNSKDSFEKVSNVG